jgi:hypothetical protein
MTVDLGAFNMNTAFSGLITVVLAYIAYKTAAIGKAATIERASNQASAVIDRAATQKTADATAESMKKVEHSVNSNTSDLVAQVKALTETVLGLSNAKTKLEAEKVASDLAAATAKVPV